MSRGRARWISEVGYVFRERAVGASKATARVYLDYLVQLARLRFDTLLASRFVRFCVVGLSGVAIDMGLLWLLSDPANLGWGLTRSKLIAAEAAIVSNFLVERRLDLPRPRPGAAHALGRRSSGC